MDEPYSGNLPRDEEWVHWHWGGGRAWRGEDMISYEIIMNDAIMIIIWFDMELLYDANMIIILCQYEIIIWCHYDYCMIWYEIIIWSQYANMIWNKVIIIWCQYDCEPIIIIKHQIQVCATEQCVGESWWMMNEQSWSDLSEDCNRERDNNI